MALCQARRVRIGKRKGGNANVCFRPIADVYASGLCFTHQEKEGRVFLLLALASIATTQEDLGCAATVQRAQAIHDPTSGKTLTEDNNDLLDVVQFYVGRLSAEDPGKDWHAMIFKTAESMTDPDEALLRGVQLCIFRAFRLSTGNKSPAPAVEKKILEQP